MTLQLYFLVFLVFLIAGGVKGLAGIGLPTIAISLMSQFIDPRAAISITLAPLVFSNLWQMLRMGHIWQTFRKYWICGTSLAVFLYISSQFAMRFSTQTLVFFLGVVVSLFSLTSLVFRPPFLKDKYDRPGQLAVGVASGLMGGVTAIWGPPILMFLLARRVEKEEFVRVIGVLLTIGSLPLVLSYWYAGRFSGETSLVSLTMVIPSIAGFAVGEHYRVRIRATSFNKMLLAGFLLLGLNLIRRAVF
jgi:uncharacterized protein